jgi:hypothetical protein
VGHVRLAAATLAGWHCRPGQRGISARRAVPPAGSGLRGGEEGRGCRVAHQCGSGTESVGEASALGDVVRMASSGSRMTRTAVETEAWLGSCSGWPELRAALRLGRGPTRRLGRSGVRGG